jgi:translation initiation factor 2B subunit (eIF-2B alpha/beta/delta family)
MDDLKLMIYESELNGEIDANTRDSLLSVLTESHSQNDLKLSASLFRTSESKDPEIKNLRKDIMDTQKELLKIDPKSATAGYGYRLCNLVIKATNIIYSYYGLMNYKELADFTQASIMVKKKYKSDAHVTPSGLMYLINHLLYAAVNKYIRYYLSYAVAGCDFAQADSLIKKLKSLRSTIKDEEACKKLDEIIEKLEKSTKNVQHKLYDESVDSLRLSIYESELNGEITAEERVELIKTLNDRLNINE